MKLAVIGAGSWGTAITGMLGEKYPDVTLWARSQRLVEDLAHTRENKAYLPGVLLPPAVSFTSDLAAAVHAAQMIILAVPSHIMGQMAQSLVAIMNHRDAIIVSAAKGFEPSTLQRMSEVISGALPWLSDSIAVLSGPNHAEEVGLKFPSASVVAAASRHIADQVQDVFMLPYFRVYTNPDMIGVELGGALKNIIALGAGIAEGLGYGDNTKAALLTRGLAEITRLGTAMGAEALTFAGLAGIGDLTVTCTSRHSRNRRAGLMIAQGQSMADIEAATQMVVEGIRAAAAAHHLSQQYQVEMPITRATYQVLYENKPAREAVLELMTRGRTHEVEEVALNSITWKD